MPTARDEAGNPVDWWFVYKLPRDATAPRAEDAPKSTGYEYLYYDPSCDHLALSEHTLEDGGGALHQTLSGIFGSVVGGPAGASDVPITTGWILYNDEIPGASRNDGTRGHTKGVLAFDASDGSAFWLLHSTPRFPHFRDVRFPEDERIYGQTMICITLTGLPAAEAIAAQMLDEQEPQTYGCFVPDDVSPSSPLRELAGMPRIPELVDPSTVAFASRGGVGFSTVAKSRHWGKDFWNDLVGPQFGVDLDVESWRRGAVPSTIDDDSVHSVADVSFVDLSPLGVPYAWHYTHDHAKWAVSTTPGWVFVADLNRMVSQEKRGGGTICFQDEVLWTGLKSIQTTSV